MSEVNAVRVEPVRGWIRIDLGELWRYRDLAYFLVWRDLKVRYRQTLFGAGWAVLQPLLLMAVFSLSIGRIAGIGPSDVPYPLFALAGLVPWILFSQSLGAAANSLVGNQNLVSKVYFPRLLLPISAAASYLVDFVVASTILLAATLLAGRFAPQAILWLPILGLLTCAAALAAGLWLAAINVKYRDVRYAIPFLIQLWLFASPVAYSSALIPPELRGIFLLNPMTGVIETFRWAVLGTAQPDLVVLVSAAASLVILAGGLAYFRRVEQTFADSI